MAISKPASKPFWSTLSSKWRGKIDFLLIDKGKLVKFLLQTGRKPNIFHVAKEITN